MSCSFIEGLPKIEGLLSLASGGCIKGDASGYQPERGGSIPQPRSNVAGVLEMEPYQPNLDRREKVAMTLPPCLSHRLAIDYSYEKYGDEAG